MHQGYSRYCLADCCLLVAVGGVIFLCCFVVVWGFFFPCHEDLVDAGAVHVDDFEDEAVPLTFLSDFWDIAEVGGQKAAHGLVVVVVFVGELGDVEALFEVVDGAEAVDVPGVLVARGELDRVGLDVGHGVADDLLQDVA